MVGEEIESKQAPGAGSGGKLRILLVDDHAILRQGLTLLLSLEDDLEIVGEASAGREGIEQARRLQPDVVVLDFSMPDIDGIQVARVLRDEMPGIRIVALSMHKHEDRAEALLAAGADAYVEKTGQPEILLAAIRGRSSNSSMTS